MEIIATKFNRKSTFIAILIASIVVLLSGVVLFTVYALIPDWDEDVYSFIALGLMIIGVFVTVLSVIANVRYFRLPQTLITYENGVFTLPKGEKVEAGNVKNMKYATATPGYKSVTVDMGFGTITFYVEDKKYKIDYIAQTVNVYNRMSDIIGEQRLLK